MARRMGSILLISANTMSRTGHEKEIVGKYEFLSSVVIFSDPNRLGNREFNLVRKFNLWMMKKYS